MRAGNLLLVVKYTRLEEQVPASPRGTKDSPPMVETGGYFLAGMLPQLSEGRYSRALEH